MLASTLRCDPWSRLCHSAFLPAASHAHPISPVSYDITKIDCYGRYRDGARVIRYPCLSMFDVFRAVGKQNRPFALASRPKSYRSRPPPYPRLWFGLPAYDTYRENATRSPSVSSSSVDESQPASCCWCRCRPAGVTAETTAVDRNRRVETTAVHQPLLQAYQSAGGTSCGPLVCLCYTRVAMHGRSVQSCLLYTSPSPRDLSTSRMPSSA